ncbi:MAG: hypothetical protein RLZZ318_54, partial [Bacteroidota bacterium]
MYRTLKHVQWPVLEEEVKRFWET